MFSELYEPMDYIKDLLDTEAGELGVRFVGYGDERLVPNYPAVLVTGSNLNRVVHGTLKFLLTFDVTIWVYHAKMSITRQARTKEDMLLVKGVRDLLHSKYTMDENLVFSNVVNETAGVINRAKSDIVIGTKVDWTGTSLVYF
jgi:hypothetical protein